MFLKFSFKISAHSVIIVSRNVSRWVVCTLNLSFHRFPKVLYEIDYGGHFNTENSLLFSRNQSATIFFLFMIQYIVLLKEAGVYKKFPRGIQKFSPYHYVISPNLNCWYRVGRIHTFILSTPNCGFTIHISEHFDMLWIHRCSSVYRFWEKRLFEPFVFRTATWCSMILISGVGRGI